MNADEQLSIKPEFWLNRELSKIADPKRRQWLKDKVFVGAAGYQKFVKLMRLRNGAHEFEEGGAWEKPFPEYERAELESKRRPCIGGCGKIMPPQFAPWGELIEDFPSICPKCKSRIKPKETAMSENQQSTEKDVQDFLAQLETKKQALKTDLKNTLAAARTKLNVLLSPQFLLSFDDIFSDPEFKEVADALNIKPRGKTTTMKVEQNGRKKRTPKSKSKSEYREGTLRFEIMKLDLWSDGKWHKRPEVKAALAAKKVAVSNLYGSSGIEGAVDDGKLEATGTKKKRAYRIKQG